MDFRETREKIEASIDKIRRDLASGIPEPAIRLKLNETKEMLQVLEELVDKDNPIHDRALHRLQAELERLLQQINSKYLICPENHLIELDLGVSYGWGYALAYYYPKELNFSDRCSSYVLQVKNGHHLIAAKYGDYIWSLLNRYADFDFDCIARVLSHNELKAAGFLGLDTVGNRLSMKSGIPYMPDIIQKSSFTPETRGFTIQERRENELRSSYKCYLQEPKKVLVIDDISTTGSTLRTIFRAIKDVSPESTVSFLVLGRTVKPNDYTEQVSFNHDYFWEVAGKNA